MTYHDHEFTCCECGQHVVAAVRTHPDPPLCGFCLYLPGWWRIPALLDRLESCPDRRAALACRGERER